MAANLTLYRGSTQARPSSHAAMLSAAKLIYGYRGCRFRRLLSLPAGAGGAEQVHVFFSVRSLLSIKVWMMRGAVECIILSVKKLYMDITRSEKAGQPREPYWKIRIAYSSAAFAAAILALASASWREQSSVVSSRSRRLRSPIRAVQYWPPLYSNTTQSYPLYFSLVIWVTG